MNEVDKKLEELREKAYEYGLQKSRDIFTKQIDKNLRKLIKLAKNPKKLTKMSESELSSLMKEFYHELLNVEENAFLVFLSFYQLYGYELPLSKSEKTILDKLTNNKSS